MSLLLKFHKMMFPKDHKPPTPYDFILPIAKNHMLVNIWESKIVGGIWKVQVNGMNITEKEFKTYPLNAGDVLKIELSFYHGYTRITYEYTMQPDWMD